MKLTRRAFFTGLAALPFVGRLFTVTVEDWPIQREMVRVIDVDYEENTITVIRGVYGSQVGGWENEFTWHENNELA